MNSTGSGFSPVQRNSTGSGFSPVQRNSTGSGFSPVQRNSTVCEQFLREVKEEPFKEPLGHILESDTCKNAAVAAEGTTTANPYEIPLVVKAQALNQLNSVSKRPSSADPADLIRSANKKGYPPGGRVGGT
ncbi:hypothetical protein Baya_16735 [Bagarius yarrelli]|uniref:Uncharacterized protein n=1 Tax=Bagarius yarrelli TaxID=175774 RepID=A0A556VWK0_BAGYA|nr:hypothetical protein Baya_16735 [Bagarius yarrelli]